MTNDIAQRFGQSADTYDLVATTQRRVAQHLASLALPLIPEGASILEIGCGTGLLSQSLVSARPAQLTINDISPEMVAKARMRIALADSQCHIAVMQLIADAETVGWPASDAVVSASAVQWFGNPLSFVAKAREALPKGGVVALATYGPATFRELRAGADNDYPSLADWQSAFTSQGFSLRVAEERLETQTFASRIALLRMVALSGIGSRGAGQTTASLVGDWSLTWHVLTFCGVLR